MKTETQPDPRPSCTSMAEIRSLDGQQVCLVGTYHSKALYQGPKKKDIDAVQAVIRLDDGAEVLLEPNWSPASRRDPPERDQFDNRRVAVDGIIHAISPAPPDPLAYITGPCVSSVRRIRLLPEEGES